NGTYTVIFTASGPCGTITDSVQITINVTSLNEVNAMSFDVYPNPANEWVNVVSNYPLERIEVLDLSSRLVQASMVGPNQFRQRITLNALESGVYLIRATGNSGKQSVERLVVR
ncbi:MAG: T9SS type A sorting domain-containing protein, partial [Bacteroidota bacterium]